MPVEISRLRCLGCQSDEQPVTNGVATVNAFVAALAIVAMEPRNALRGRCLLLVGAARMRIFALSEKVAELEKR